ncbi:Usherin Usher syndrome type IIa protein -like protein [Channa argus]|uniref:Usherin Usher syndrome type IIa protein-like protein n=1 Tax=Channa argus TaxID=215402 RepID=A0A6G1P7L7_CHAAH|nr:Usherin Usher syndrome type IIa protein -like protein [Channa argus]
MLGHSANPILGSSGVKGQKWTKDKEDWKTEKGGNSQSERRREDRKELKPGRREQPWSFWKRKMRKYQNNCGQGKGECKSEVCADSSAAETEEGIKQWETSKSKCLPLLRMKVVTKEEEEEVGQNLMNARRHQPILWIALVFLSLCLKPASSQGNFPRMENIAAFKPVSTSPARSTCGIPERSSYCQPPTSQTELTTCYQAFCIQECPYRSSTPPYAPLLLPAHRMLLEKSSRGRLVFAVTVSRQEITLRYGQSNSQTQTLTARFRTEGKLALGEWTHLVLQCSRANTIERILAVHQSCYRFIVGKGKYRHRERGLKSDNKENERKGDVNVENWTYTKSRCTF